MRSELKFIDKNCYQDEFCTTAVEWSLNSPATCFFLILNVNIFYIPHKMMALLFMWSNAA